MEISQWNGYKVPAYFFSFMLIALLQKHVVGGGWKLFYNNASFLQ